MADVRRAVRDNWQEAGVQSGDLVLCAVSGGADSMALAAASVFEGGRAGVRVGAVIVEHGLQEITKQVAETTAESLRKLGLDPVSIYAVKVGDDGGPEAAARSARYAAFDIAIEEHSAKFVSLGHTLNDQAETVLLGLARGSGARSISGMSAVSGQFLRPLLTIERATTEAFCRDSGIEVWNDPQNSDESFTRVRIRNRVLPLLEETLGQGVAEALARTADQLREDADALEEIALAHYNSHVKLLPTSVELPVESFEGLAGAIVARVIKLAIEQVGGIATSSSIDSVSQLITDWHGQKTLTLAGARVERTGKQLVFRTTKALKTGAC